MIVKTLKRPSRQSKNIVEAGPLQLVDVADQIAPFHIFFGGHPVSGSFFTSCFN